MGRPLFLCFFVIGDGRAGKIWAAIAIGEGRVAAVQVCFVAFLGVPRESGRDGVFRRSIARV